MRKTSVFILMVIFASVSDAAELVRTMPDIVTAIKQNSNGICAAIQNGKVTILNKDFKTAAEINEEAKDMHWLSNDYLAIAVGENIRIANLKNPTSPQIEYRFKAGGAVVSLHGNDRTIVYGTADKAIYRINNWRNTGSVPSLAATTKTVPLFVRLTNDALLVIPDGEFSRVYDTSTGLMACSLENDQYSPVRAVDIKQGSNTIALGTDAGDVLEYNISIDSYLPAKRKPLRATALGSPIVALKYTENKRYLAAGLANNEIRLIDTEFIKDGNYISIGKRSGYMGGSLTGVAAGESILVAIGKNLFIETGSEGGRLQITLNPPSSASASLSLKYTDGHVQEKYFNFSYSQKTQEWLVPVLSGDAEISVVNGDGISIEGHTKIKIIQGKTTEISLKIVPVPVSLPPEAPKAPEFKTLPVIGSVFSDVLFISHGNVLSLWSGDSCSLIKLSSEAFPLAGSQGKTAAGLKDKIAVYDSTGKSLYNIPIPESPRYIALNGNTLAAVVSNTLKIWEGSNLKREIKIDAPVTAFALSADAKIIQIGSNRLLRKYDVSSGNEIEVYTPIRAANISHLTFGNSSAAYPAGRYTGICYEDNLFRLTDTSNGKILREFAFEEGKIISVSFIDQNNIAVRISKGNSDILTIIDTQNGQIINKIPGGLLVLPGGNIVVGAEKDGIFLWEKGKRAGVLLTDGNKYYFQYEKDGKFNVGSSEIVPAANGKLPF